MKNRAGDMISVLSGDTAYKAYRPNPLPPLPALEMDNELISLLSRAHKSRNRVFEYSAYLTILKSGI